MGSRFASWNHADVRRVKHTRVETMGGKGALAIDASGPGWHFGERPFFEEVYVRTEFRTLLLHRAKVRPGSFTSFRMTIRGLEQLARRLEQLAKSEKQFPDGNDRQNSKGRSRSFSSFSDDNELSADLAAGLYHLAGVALAGFGDYGAGEHAGYFFYAGLIV